MMERRTKNVNLIFDGPIRVKDSPIKVKINNTEDVIEYLEGPAKGEQIFITYEAFIREICRAKNCSKEEAEKKYLMTIDEFEEKMKNKPNGSLEYNKIFNTEIDNHLAGYFSGDTHTLWYIGFYSNIWLVGGNYAFMNSKERGTTSINLHKKNYGFSGRLLKN